MFFFGFSRLQMTSCVRQMECEANLRKAKQAFMVRCEEHDKAKTAACKAEEEGGGSTAKSVEKKKRLEEEARNKVQPAAAAAPPSGFQI